MTDRSRDIQEPMTPSEPRRDLTAQTFPRRRAAELMDATFVAKWADRGTLGDAARAALRDILGRLVTEGTPIDLASLPHSSAAVEELDARDLVYLSEGRIVLAYPWSATPTAFVTVLADGRQRWACCAIDALGVAAMLGQPVTVRAACHHCAEPIELAMTPAGPLNGEGVMAWIGDRGDLRGKACTAL
jgi:alkylmercury lyase-like protein